MKTLKLIFILGELLFLFFINYYALHIKVSANQSGLDVLFWGGLFFSLGLIYILLTKLKPKLVDKSDKMLLIISLLFILIGVNFFLFDYFNIMVEYDRWVSKRMPVKPFWF